MRDFLGADAKQKKLKRRNGETKKIRGTHLSSFEVFLPLYVSSFLQLFVSTFLNLLKEAFGDIQQKTPTIGEHFC
jgi:hypothetical protein